LQPRPDGTPKDTLKHIRETGIIDAERLRVNLDAYKPIARLFGNPYARLGEKSCSSANPLPNGTPRMASTRRPIAPRRSPDS
jgi:hypothetical protein